MELSQVVAPLACLDCPARAAVQNVMQCNGEYGCSFCKHPGKTCRTGSGHNRVFTNLDTDPPKRTAENMISQATYAIEYNLEHVKGVKSPSIAALIPHLLM